MKGKSDFRWMGRLSCPAAEFFAIEDRPRLMPRKTRKQGMSSIQPKSAMLTVASVLSFVTLTFGTSPVAAVEQCRFIQAKGEREACYARQEAELTVKRKPEPKRDTSMEALQQMKQEDAELNRQIHGICRGC
jgi:hypothetical protein